MTESESNSGERQANRLAGCSSPYLQQHAHNPVDWYPWGQEAIRRAREADRPILLSIGYSACHWCHVMARESFEDPEIARLMNRDFVNVKVDREERPDLDELYMRAVQLMTGAGGWPLTVFLTPELVPFHGGTYFPPEDRAGMPGFPRVLRAVREAYEQRREEVDSSAAQVLEAIRKSSAPPPGGELSDELMDLSLKSFSGSFDMEHGGFGTGAKFPQAPALDFLLRCWSERGEDRALLMLERTLENMAAGGIFDQLGGGFHRYTIDPRWRVPHFEKMLYDNAQLAALYADAHRATGREEFRRVAAATADYVLRELRDPGGGFYSSQDADSEGVEGAYYAWTYQDILDCAGREEGEIVARHFGATRKGNWEEGKNVLRRAVPAPELARQFGLDEPEASAIVERGVRRMLEARRRRVPPAVDRKVMTDWNALMITALARLGRGAGGGTYLVAARACAEFLLTALREDGRLMHTWREGGAEVPAFLSDHSLLCAALLDLYESTFELRWLREARRLAERMVEHYWDEESGLFEEVGAQNEQMVAPVRTASDEPLPSGSSVACEVLLRLGALSEGGRFGELAGSLLRTSAALMRQSPMGTGRMLSAALRYLSEPQEFVIVGLQGEGAEALRAVVDRFYLPHLVRLAAEPAQAEDLAGQFPLLRGKQAVDGRPTAFLCSGGACRQPVQDPHRLEEQLQALSPARR
ncbi:MAG: thioredoxin domain-containing protein [Planctomycetota bacterium]